MNSGQAVYAYDGDGQLVARTSRGVTTNFLVDAANLTGYTQIAEERIGASVIKSYLYGAQRVSMRNSAVHYYGYDAHSGVRTLMDWTGAVTDTYEYDAFGTVVGRTGTTDNVFTYRGEQLDTALGFQYLRDRWLDTSRGRFLSRDKLENGPASTTWHPYAYVRNKPADLVDPSGYMGIGDLFDDVAVSIGAVWARSSLNPFRPMPAQTPSASGNGERATILRTFGETVDDMTRAGRRFTNAQTNDLVGLFSPLINAMCNDTFTFTRGCGQQAGEVYNALTSLQHTATYPSPRTYELAWISSGLTPFGSDYGTGAFSLHQWIDAGSQPRNSVLMLDPWLGKAYEIRYFPEWQSGAWIQNNVTSRVRAKYPNHDGRVWSDVTGETGCASCQMSQP